MYREPGVIINVCVLQYLSTYRKNINEDLPSAILKCQAVHTVCSAFLPIQWGVIAWCIYKTIHYIAYAYTSMLQPPSSGNCNTHRCDILHIATYALDWQPWARELLLRSSVSLT